MADVTTSAALHSHESLVRSFLAQCDPNQVAALERQYPTLSRWHWQRIADEELTGQDPDRLLPYERRGAVPIRARKLHEPSH